MKTKKLLMFCAMLLICGVLSGCAGMQELEEEVTIDNINTINTDFQYSTVSGKKLKEIKYNEKIGNVETVLKHWADLSANRNFETIKGDEEYETYHQDYIKKLNAEKDDVEYTKKIYKQYEMVTSLVDVKVNQIILADGYAFASVNVTDRMENSNSPEFVLKYGYVGGIGDFKSRIYNTILVEENGEYLIYDKQQVTK